MTTTEEDVAAAGVVAPGGGAVEEATGEVGDDVAQRRHGVPMPGRRRRRIRNIRRIRRRHFVLIRATPLAYYRLPWGGLLRRIALLPMLSSSFLLPLSVIASFIFSPRIFSRPKSLLL